MVRILIVTHNIKDPNLHRLFEAFANFSVQLSSPNITMQQIQALNPDCILSFGHIPSQSSLWSMPLWRRRTWLSVPDFLIAPMALRQSVLSLLNSSTDPGVFSDKPTVTVCVLNHRITTTSVLNILSKQTYDNWEYLADDTTHTKTYLQQSMDAFTQSRDGLVWLSNGAIDGVPDSLLESIVNMWMKNDSQGSIIIADRVQSHELLDNLVGDVPLEIRHVFIDRRSFFTTRSSIHRLPLQGIIGLIAVTLSNQNTQIVADFGGISIDRSILWNTSDELDTTLAHGPVQWAKWLLTSESLPVSAV